MSVNQSNKVAMRLELFRREAVVNLMMSPNTLAARAGGWPVNVLYLSLITDLLFLTETK